MGSNQRHGSHLSRCPTTVDEGLGEKEGEEKMNQVTEKGRG